MKKLLLIFLLCLPCTMVVGQYVASYKRAADAYFAQKDYYAAAEFYKKAMNMSGDSTAISPPYFSEVTAKATEKQGLEYKLIAFRLAESSRLYKNFKDAEIWYGISSTFPEKEYAEAQYWYGVSLRANQKYEQAILELESFLNKGLAGDIRKDAELELASARFASEAMRNVKPLQVTKLNSGINVAGSNYAALATRDGIIFTSSRPISPEVAKEVLTTGTSTLPVTKKATPYINALYVFQGNPVGAPKAPEMLRINRPAGVEFGAPAMTPDGSRLYFTAWKTTDHVKSYAIWSSYKKADNSWSEPAPLPATFNTLNSNNKQPFVTADGKFLLFSSNRSGGQGKFDLWYVPLRSDGGMGQAVNLGPVINTADDEEAPNYNINNDQLIYSSNGKIGLGGFDFYSAIGDLVHWTKPVNMGYPYNSSKDDIYFTATNTLGTEGYISSDRESVCCLELFFIKAETIRIAGSVNDCNTDGAMPKVQVTLQQGAQRMRVLTDANGMYSFEVANRNPVDLRFETAGYFVKTARYSTEQLAKADTLLHADLCLTSFKLNVPIVLKNIYFDFNSAELNAHSKSTLDNLVTILEDNDRMRIELSAHTDSKGTEAYNLDLSERRANSCVSYLVSKGIGQERVSARGYGESQPLAANTLANGQDNPAGRQLNRRIEFKVTKNEDAIAKNL